MEEHIDLSCVAIPGVRNHDMFKPKLDPELEPKSRFTQTGRQRKFLLYADGVIAITSQGSKHPILLTCRFLQSPRQTKWHIPYQHLASSVVLLIVALLPPLLKLPLAISLVALAMSMAFAILAIRKVRLYCPLVSIGGNIVLTKLTSPISEKAVLQDFIKEIQAMVKKNQTRRRKVPLPALVTEHRRLLEEKLISQENYEKAKVQLFKKK